MIIAMALVRMMEMAIHEIIYMIAMWHGLMSAIGTMLMGRFMRTAVVCGSAGIGIFIRDRDAMLLDLPILTLMMQMAIVEIVRMTVMLNRSVPAVRAMLVVVIVVQMCHESSSLFYKCCVRKTTSEIC